MPDCLPRKQLLAEKIEIEWIACELLSRALQTQVAPAGFLQRRPFSTIYCFLAGELPRKWPFICHDTLTQTLTLSTGATNNGKCATVHTSSHDPYSMAIQWSWFGWCHSSYPDKWWKHTMPCRHCSLNRLSTWENCYLPCLVLPKNAM